MKNYIQEGDIIDVTLAGTKSAGDIVAVGGATGATAVGVLTVLVNGGVSGDVVAARTKGVFTVPKATTVATSVGTPLYWDNTDGNFNDDNSNNPLRAIALAVTVTGAASTTVKAILKNNV